MVAARRVILAVGLLVVLTTMLRSAWVCDDAMVTADVGLSGDGSAAAPLAPDWTVLAHNGIGGLRLEAEGPLAGNVSIGSNASDATATVPVGLASPQSSNFLEYQRPLTLSPLAWDDTERLTFEYEPGELDDGLDNDGDGLVDEGRLIRYVDYLLPTERRIVLCSGVAEFLEGEEGGNLADDNGNGLVDEPGLGFDIDGGTLNVRMSVAGTGPTGTEIVRTRVASVFLRN